MAIPVSWKFWSSMSFLKLHPESCDGDHQWLIFCSGGETTAFASRHLSGFIEQTRRCFWAWIGYSVNGTSMTSHVCKCLATNNWEVQQCSSFSTQDDNYWNYLARYPHSSACRFATCCPCFIRLPIWAVSFNPHMFFLRVTRCFGTQNRCYWMLLTHQNQRKIYQFIWTPCLYYFICIWRFPEIGVPLNHPFPQGFSIVNHPAIGGAPIYGNPISRCVWRALYQLRLPWVLPSSERMMNLMRRWWMMIAFWVHIPSGKLT